MRYCIPTPPALTGRLDGIPHVSVLLRRVTEIHWKTKNLRRCKGLRNVWRAQRRVISYVLYQQETNRERQAQERSDSDGKDRKKEDEVISTDESRVGSVGADLSAATSTTLTPKWLKRWERYHQGGSTGFTAFRTALYNNESRWIDFIASVYDLTKHTLNSPEHLNIEAAY